MGQIRVILTLILLYLAVSGNLEGRNIILGIFLALGVNRLLRSEHPPTRIRDLPRMTWYLAIYILMLIWEIIKNGVVVAIIVLSKRKIEPGIIAVPSGCENGAPKICLAMSALAITASPGEMVVEMSDAGVMYVHLLEARDKEKALIAAQIARRDYFKRIFA